MPTEMNKHVKVPSEEHPNKITMFIYNWAASNIFLFRRWDGCFYISLYILVPNILLLVDFYTSTTDLAFAQCYISIIINAFNCLYDTMGRWNDNMPVKKLKLILIFFSCLTAFIYGSLRLFGVLAGWTLVFKSNIILFLYCPAILVALIDFAALGTKTDALKEMIKD